MDGVFGGLYVLIFFIVVFVLLLGLPPYQTCM